MSKGASREGKELALLLEHLAEVLATLGRGVRDGDGSVETWSDGSGVYVDSHLDQPKPERVDICLHDGRIFMAVQR